MDRENWTEKTRRKRVGFICYTGYQGIINYGAGLREEYVAQ
jgi:hypothetical protein